MSKNRLTILEKTDKKTSDGRYLYKMACSCGNIVFNLPKVVRSGNTKSCGCLKREVSANSVKKVRHLAMKAVCKTGKPHGMSRTREYRIWRGMIDRCTNKKLREYTWYGGRGISVCDRWRIFENFYKDVGKIPQGMSIDRIDFNGNYCPENCRIANKETQANNTRKNVFIEHNGLRLTLSQWSRRLGGNRHLVASRLKGGWDDISSVTKKPR